MDRKQGQFFMIITHADYIAMQTRLSKTKQPPPSKSGVEREAELHAQIMDECRRRGWLFFHGAMCERSHRTEGEPDFLIFGTHGTNEGTWHPQSWLIECKTRTGKLTPAQQAVAAHAASLGHTVHVVRSFEEFLNVIN